MSDLERNAERFVDYGRTLLALGYGGLLTIWTQSRDVMDDSAFAFAAGLVLISLLLYLWNEVSTIRAGAAAIFAFKVDGDKDKFDVAMMQTAHSSHRRFWWIAAPGFAGGGLMVLCFFLRSVSTWGVCAS